MPMPYRVPSPPSPEEPEAEEPYAKVLRAQQRRARVAASIAGVIVGGLVLAAVARPAPAQTPESDVAKREEMRRWRAHEAITSARSRATAEQERFAVDIRGALATGIHERPDLGACPITLAQPTGIGRAFPLVVVDRNEVDTLHVPSQAIAEVLVDVARAEEHLKSGRYEEATLYADALDRPGRLVVDVVLVREVDEPPRVASDSSFYPGKLAGTAYLYDFASHRVICSAHASAANPSAIGYAYAIEGPAASYGRSRSLEDTLAHELRIGIERSIATAMKHRAGP
jgi:hypothetical protein